MSITLIGGKGSDFNTLKCLSLVTMQSAPALSAQSTNLLSSGSTKIIFHLKYGMI